MKNWINAAAVLLALCCVPAQAHDLKSPTVGQFDATAARLRYDNWYHRFLANIRTLAQETRAGTAPSQSRINDIFSDSVVPDSRMAMLLALLAKQPENFGASRTDPPVMGWASIMMVLLDHALPAGQGGPYTRDDMIPADKGAFVWYMTLHTDSSISDVFKNPNIFASYHLPPDGVLERRAYPFITFREEHGKLYCTSISMELYQVVSAVRQLQLY